MSCKISSVSLRFSSNVATLARNCTLSFSYLKTASWYVASFRSSIASNSLTLCSTLYTYTLSKILFLFHPYSIRIPILFYYIHILFLFCSIPIRTPCIRTVFIYSIRILLVFLLYSCSILTIIFYSCSIPILFLLYSYSIYIPFYYIRFLFCGYSYLVPASHSAFGHGIVK